MRASYLEQMRAHVDDGGKLTHANAVDLLAEIERLLAPPVTLEQRRKTLESQRITAAANVLIAETSVRIAEQEVRRIDDELDSIFELEMQEIDRRRRRVA